MEIQEVQALVRLGLTFSEAKVYLTLAKLEKANAKTIYKSATVARQDIYRILAALEEKGLIERLIAIPAEYKPVPINWCVHILTERIKKELSENERAANETLKKAAKKENSESTILDEETSFVLSPKNRDLFCKKITGLLNNARKSIDIAITAKRFRFIGTIFAKDFKRSLEGDVKVRVILEHEKNEKPLLRSWKSVQRHPLFEMRYLSAAIPTPVWLVDNKKMFVVTSGITYPSCEVSTLWTDNLLIVKTFQNYFESLWAKAKRSNKSKSMQSQTVPRISLRPHLTRDAKKHLKIERVEQNSQESPLN